MLIRGAQIGSYEVLESLGAGGMGEVYRAHDARLGRDVAIKILADQFKLDPKRLLRFEREAQVLASLNHPNIAMLYGVERLGDSQALVLELVEGSTLADRIAQGPMPMADALAVARQMASALEAAHEQGVVHRDLKPSNIKLRSDGAVKLLDFGLAKVSEPLLGGADPRAVTLTVEGAAHAGVMGTPAYMSPEQARGQLVDKRTDIWAFGCVLYEMLTGEPAFKGEHMSDVVAKIIEREVDFEALPRATPAAVRNLLRRCLRKDSRERLRDIGDARFGLEEASAADQVGGTGRGLTRWPFKAAVVALTIAGAVAVMGGAGLLRTPQTVEKAAAPISRFSIPVSLRTSMGAGRRLAISPDGSRIAYLAERQRFFVRSLDQLDSIDLHEDAVAPFFSPDGKWIAFSDGQTLKKMSSGGGVPVPIMDSGAGAIGSWSSGGIDLASMNGLFHLSADGGGARQLNAALGPNEQAMFPQLLPDHKNLLYTVLPTRTNTINYMYSWSRARVDLLDMVSGARRTLIENGGRAQYVPTGHLVYVADGDLYAVAFDLGKLETRGAPVQMVKQLGMNEFGVADNGTLAYYAGPGPPSRSLVWVDRQGRERSLDAPIREYIYPRLSPDGTRVAIDVNDEYDRNIWMWDLRRSTLERFTLDPAGNPMLAWSRDGRGLAFGSDRSGVSNLFFQAADGSGEPQRLLPSDRIQQPLSFAPDGRLIFSADVAGQGRDIQALSMDGSHRVERIVYGPTNEGNAEVSPDGRWIAYDSDESGQFEVYVRPYPNAYAGPKWQISTGGGLQPLWARNGHELYYRDFGGAMYATPVKLAPTFVPGAAAKLFANPAYYGGGNALAGRTYDVSPDGRRFLMFKKQAVPAEHSSPKIVVVLNWFEELKRAVPVARDGA